MVTKRCFAINVIIISDQIASFSLNNWRTWITVKYIYYPQEFAEEENSFIIKLLTVSLFEFLKWNFNAFQDWGRPHIFIFSNENLNSKIWNFVFGIASLLVPSLWKRKRKKKKTFDQLIYDGDPKLKKKTCFIKLYEASNKDFMKLTESKVREL